MKIIFVSRAKDDYPIMVPSSTGKTCQRAAAVLKVHEREQSAHSNS